MNVDEFYNRIAQAETGNEPNKYIRTRVHTKKGSSAFGEVQATKRLITDALNDPEGFNLAPEELQFLGWLNDQQTKMLKYGGNDMIEGMERYDYGRSGDFQESMIPVYESSMKKIMQKILAKNNNDPQMSRREWRFGGDGKNDIKNQDTDYVDRFNL